VSDEEQAVPMYPTYVDLTLPVRHLLRTGRLSSLHTLDLSDGCIRDAELLSNVLHTARASLERVSVHADEWLKDDDEDNNRVDLNLFLQNLAKAAPARLESLDLELEEVPLVCSLFEPMALFTHQLPEVMRNCPAVRSFSLKLQGEPAMLGLRTMLQELAINWPLLTELELTMGIPELNFDGGEELRLTVADVHLVFESCNCLETLTLQLDDPVAISTVLNRVDWLRLPASLRTLEVVGMSIYRWADWHELCGQLTSLTLTANWADMGDHMMTYAEYEAFAEEAAILQEEFPAVNVEYGPLF
jgi:hypothetical protein